MANTLNVALIGAGRTGTPLLKELLKYGYIKLIGVADRNEKAPGIKLAAQKKIYTTTDPMMLLQKKEDRYPDRRDRRREAEKKHQGFFGSEQELEDDHHARTDRTSFYQRFYQESRAHAEFPSEGGRHRQVGRPQTLRRPGKFPGLFCSPENVWGSGAGTATRSPSRRASGPASSEVKTDARLPSAARSQRKQPAGQEVLDHLDENAIADQAREFNGERTRSTARNGRRAARAPERLQHGTTLSFKLSTIGISLVVVRPDRIL